MDHLLIHKVLFPSLNYNYIIRGARVGWGWVGAPIIIFLFVAKSTPHIHPLDPFSKLFWNIGHFPKHRRILDMVFCKGSSLYSFNIYGS